MLKRFFFGLLLSVLAAQMCVLPLPSLAQSGQATLFLSPASGEYNVGSTFTVKLQVNSGGSPGINAAEGGISFDNDILSVANVSKNASIFDLWTQDPSFSNSGGQITFGGGSPSPYSGSAGTVISITFNAESVGAAQVSVTSGVVLAADGQGTNVYSGGGSATYTVVEADEEEVVEETPDSRREEIIERRQQEEEDEEPQGIKPPTPDVSSPTHPETDKWYSDNDPEFSWKILPSLTGISYDISEEPEGDPGDETEGVVETQQYENVEDGEWYFHLKYQNKYGWGDIRHRPFLVDATPPEEFSITVDNQGDPTNPVPKIIFGTTDKTSGIDYYNVRIGDQSQKVLPSKIESDGYIRPDPLKYGEYNLSVAAVDMAGNAASTTMRFVVEPLRSPVITSVPEILDKGTELAIRGTSFYSDATVKIIIQPKTGENEEKVDPEIVTATTDSAGNWSYYRKEGLDRGTYEIWAQLLDGRGAQSRESSKYLLYVQSPSIIQAYGWIIILALLALIGLLAAYIFYQRQTFLLEKTRIRRETHEVKARLSKIFQALREEVDELIVMADKKPGLSESERKVKEKLEESLDIAEEFIGKEVADVEKEIKMPKKEE